MAKGAAKRRKRKKRIAPSSNWLWGACPALVVAAIAATPRAQGALRTQLLVAAALMLASLVVVWRRARAQRQPLELELGIRRPHYMQALTQGGVYACWGWYWPPVAAHIWLILAQVAFAYQIDMLLAWWRGRRFALGFGQFPIVFSINLFLWFKDDWFAWQLVLVALAYLGKELVRWQRDGQSRHIFNPSAFGLAIVSIGLLATGTSHTTLGYEIALTQEYPPYIFEVLFALGLIVQLQFPVVLVTLSAALTCWLCSAVYTQVTGIYMFATTAIPSAVLLGMLLLVTDPATSPRSRSGKVLFGASYGALVFALFPLLESFGPYGFFDKLLPVPILNLLVRRYDALGDRLDARLGSLVKAVPRANLVHVALWIVGFSTMLASNAVGRDHPGRSVAFWRKACEDKRGDACATLLTILANACERNEMVACQDLGAELAQRERTLARGKPAEHYLARACEAGLPESCAMLAARLKSPDDARSFYERACQKGHAVSCHNLAAGYESHDPARAKELYEQACRAGVAESCSSLAAIAMRDGHGGDKRAAAAAFTRACDGGDATGCANLALMLWLGDGIPKDVARAAALDDKACKGNVAMACARLAEAYAGGNGVAINAATARDLRDKACRGGYQPACSAH